MLKVKTLPREMTDDLELRELKPGIIKAADDKNRNRLIPNQVMDTVRNAYNQANLGHFFEVEQPPAFKSELKAELKQETQFTINPDFSLEKPDSTKVEEVISQVAAKVAKDVNANCVISIERGRVDCEDPNYISAKVVIFKKVKRKMFDKHEYLTRMKRQLSGSIMPIKELLMEAIKKKYVEKNDRVVCVEDESLGMGYKGLLFIFDVDTIFFNMSIHQLSDRISPEVIEAIINLAVEISSEGREGRHIGTAFVVGPASELAPYTKQMIINPFTNCPEELRRITDPNIKETVKGFAQLDGVFVINEAGVIQSAGTHINLDLDKAEISGMDGFGTRHRYAAGLTKVTSAVAVVVSESGGAVRIFKDGKLLLKL